MKATFAKSTLMTVIENDNTFHLIYYTTFYKTVDTVLSHMEARVVTFLYHADSIFQLCISFRHINPLQTKRGPLYLKTQSVPRCKHFSSRL
jgi:hypothetical protein